MTSLESGWLASSIIRSHLPFTLGGFFKRWRVVIAGLEINPLERKLGTGDNIIKQGNDDIDVFSIANVIAGPLEMIPRQYHRWECPAYPKLVNLYDKVKKVDRDRLYKFSSLSN